MLWSDCAAFWAADVTWLLIHERLLSWFLSTPVSILLFPLDKKKNKDEENWCVKLPESASLIGMGDKGRWEDSESRYIAVIDRWVRPEVCTSCLSFRWVLWFFKPSFCNLRGFFCCCFWVLCYPMAHSNVLLIILHLVISKNRTKTTVLEAADLVDTHLQVKQISLPNFHFICDEDRFFPVIFLTVVW